MKDSIVQIVIAILAVLIGYPNLGSFFIVAMAPLVIYMVVKQNAMYLPALMIHCTSGTSVMYVVLISMLVVCIIKQKDLWSNIYTMIYYIIMLLMLPLYLILTYQRILLDGDTWQGALGYTAFFLSFWAFLYYYLISNTFTQRVIKELLISLLVFVTICFFVRLWGIRIVYMSFIVGLIFGILLIIQRQKIFYGFIMSMIAIVIIPLLPEMTFSILFTLILAFIIALFSRPGHSTKLTRMITGPIVYIAILALMVFGMANYTTATFGAYSDTIEFSDWSLLFNRLQFKLFDDRAPFWEAGWYQLLEYKPILPLHDIPDIIAYSADGHIFDDVSFGAHNSPLQLFRIFGFLMGGGLIICYMISTISASSFFLLRNKDLASLSLFSVSFSYMIVLFLTGTAAMLPDVSLFTFGLMGIAYGQFIGQKQIITVNEKQPLR